VTWSETAPGLDALEPEAQARLAGLAPQTLPRGTVLFRPGEAAQGFAMVLAGRIEVFLTGPTGRELLLYAVEPGQSCVQSTLGLLGGEAYSGEAVVASDARVVLVPRPLFLALMETSAGFRQVVFAAFAARLQDIMHLVERVAFLRIEARLAAALLGLAEGGVVAATHADLATRIGSAREVVSRRLEAFQAQGWVSTDRGAVRIVDAAALRRLAAAGM
jgi:CRP/FNR family transcriptional regulator